MRKVLIKELIGLNLNTVTLKKLLAILNKLLPQDAAKIIQKVKECVENGLQEGIRLLENDEMYKKRNVDEISELVDIIKNTDKEHRESLSFIAQFKDLLNKRSHKEHITLINCLENCNYAIWAITIATNSSLIHKKASDEVIELIAFIKDLNCGTEKIPMVVTIATNFAVVNNKTIAEIKELLLLIKKQCFSANAFALASSKEILGARTHEEHLYLMKQVSSSDEKKLELITDATLLENTKSAEDQMKLIAKAEESHYAKWVTDIITAVAILKKRTSEEIIDLINTVGALKDPTKAIPIVFDMYLINNKPVFWQIALIKKCEEYNFEPYIVSLATNEDILKQCSNHRHLEILAKAWEYKGDKRIIGILANRCALIRENFDLFKLIDTFRASGYDNKVFLLIMNRQLLEYPAADQIAIIYFYLGKKDIVGPDLLFEILTGFALQNHRTALEQRQLIEKVLPYVHIPEIVSLVTNKELLGTMDISEHLAFIDEKIRELGQKIVEVPKENPISLSDAIEISSKEALIALIDEMPDDFDPNAQVIDSARLQRNKKGDS